MLQIHELKVIYPAGIEALKSISLNAEEGEIIAIIGRSGAGKSTLFRCINGLQRATSGSIWLDGKQVTAMSEKELAQVRRSIGFIWQEYNLVGRLPVITNVLTGCLGHNPSYHSLLGFFSRRKRQIALNNLERVNLLHRANSRADRLSGGEKQRVAIARAISQQPKIILADEPVASLDPELAAQVMEILVRITRQDGMLTLISLHRIDLAKEIADRIVAIAQGRIVFDGKPHDLTKPVLDCVYHSAPE